MTPEGLSTIDQVLKYLELHIRTHPTTAPQQGTAASNEGIRAPKTEGPKVGLDTTEREWNQFIHNWEVFKEYARLEEWVDIKYHLQACLETPLKNNCIDNGLKSWTSKEDMLKNVKKLAVKGQNSLVAEVKFFNIGQNRGEAVNNLLARLRGVASSCNFEVKCSNCNNMTSYTEQMLARQIVRGVVDPDIQEKVMARAGDKGRTLTLNEVIT